MAVNKVIYGGRTIMDVTEDTVTPETLAEGATATNAKGERILGMMKAGGSGKHTCRFIIGTSTAGWTEADCDYLCDGTADDAEINAAIQALPTGGGEICILDGIYYITDMILLNKTNITLMGNGAATVLQSGIQDSGFIMMRCMEDNCSVLRIKFTTDKIIAAMLQVFNPEGVVNGIRVRDCIFKGSDTQYCIALTKAENTILEGCGIDDNPQAASVALLGGTKNNIVRNNYAIHTSAYYGFLNIYSEGTHNQITGNYMLSIVMRRTCDSLIQSNIGPIRLGTGSAAPGNNKNNSITGNIVQNQDGTYAGLDVKYLSDSIVSGNIIKEIVPDTVERNNIISDNVLMSTRTV